MVGPWGEGGRLRVVTRSLQVDWRGVGVVASDCGGGGAGGGSGKGGWGLMWLFEGNEEKGGRGVGGEIEVISGYLLLQFGCMDFGREATAFWGHAGFVGGNGWGDPSSQTVLFR